MQKEAVSIVHRYLDEIQVRRKEVKKVVYMLSLVLVLAVVSACGSEPTLIPVPTEPQPTAEPAPTAVDMGLEVLANIV